MLSDNPRSIDFTNPRYDFNTHMIPPPTKPLGEQLKEEIYRLMVIHTKSNAHVRIAEGIMDFLNENKCLKS